MSVESYMHRYAKSVLAGWLREWAAKSEDAGFQCDAFRDWAPFSWRVNRGPPHYGVWEEWPIIGDRGVTEVWDETAWPWWVQGLVPPSIFGDDVDDYKMTPEDVACERLLNARPPTFDELVRIKLAPTAILDVAIQHKGALSIGFEVVHRHDVSDQKLKLLQKLERNSVQIYTVPADRILKQVGMPERFFGERIV
jgi:hypothetical protein